MLTTFDLDAYVYDALRAGASGFLLKDTLPEDLVAAIRVVARGDALIAPGITKRLIEQFARAAPAGDAAGRARRAHATRGRGAHPRRPRALQRRDRRGARAQPRDRQDTRQAHPGKLGLRDRVQAVVLAYEAGLVHPGASPARATRERRLPLGVSAGSPAGATTAGVRRAVDCAARSIATPRSFHGPSLARLPVASLASALVLWPGAGQAASRTQTLRFFDKPVSIKLTHADGTVVDHAPYPEAQPGDTLDVNSLDYRGDHAHHAKRSRGAGTCAASSPPERPPANRTSPSAARCWSSPAIPAR